MVKDIFFGHALPWLPKFLVDRRLFLGRVGEGWLAVRVEFVAIRGATRWIRPANTYFFPFWL